MILVWGRNIDELPLGASAFPTCEMWGLHMNVPLWLILLLAAFGIAGTFAFHWPMSAISFLGTVLLIAAVVWPDV